MGLDSGAIYEAVGVSRLESKYTPGGQSFYSFSDPISLVGRGGAANFTLTNYYTSHFSDDGSVAIEKTRFELTCK